MLNSAEEHSSWIVTTQSAFFLINAYPIRLSSNFTFNALSNAVSMNPPFLNRFLSTMFATLVMFRSNRVVPVKHVADSVQQRTYLTDHVSFVVVVGDFGVTVFHHGTRFIGWVLGFEFQRPDDTVDDRVGIQSTIKIRYNVVATVLATGSIVLNGLDVDVFVQSVDHLGMQLPSDSAKERCFWINSKLLSISRVAACFVKATIAFVNSTQEIRKHKDHLHKRRGRCIIEIIPRYRSAAAADTCVREGVRHSSQLSRFPHFVFRMNDDPQRERHNAKQKQVQTAHQKGAAVVKERHSG